MTKDMTMLILSCDKFSDLWDGHVKLLEENWSDRDVETYIVTDVPSAKGYCRIKIISAGTDTEWTERLAFALQKVKTKYVFITLDDYFLIRKVNDQSITNLRNMMEKEEIDYTRLFPRPKRATLNQLNGYKGIRQIDISRTYSVNLYPGLWKKSFLESTVKKPLNVWLYEVSLFKRAMEYGANCVVSQRNEFRILDVVRKGKLLRRSAKYFKKHPGIYNGNRDVNTWKYEFVLTLQQQVSRHFPRILKDRIKRFMEKRGHCYYSDDIQ